VIKEKKLINYGARDRNVKINKSNLLCFSFFQSNYFICLFIYIYVLYL